MGWKMELSRTESDLIRLLAHEWYQAGPPGYIETTEIATRLNIAVSDVKSTIQALFEKGVVDTDKVDTFAAYLTPEGYTLATKT
jgi:Mn-dependent DtxR family transcriptional regulator